MMVYLEIFSVLAVSTGNRMQQKSSKIWQPLKLMAGSDLSAGLGERSDL
jgi:hypothetical protein